jgi:hypothetical protein
MVNEQAQHRTFPSYSLDRIHELARFRHVEYGSSRVTVDVENLGYSIDDICRCLEILQPGHFSHAERYGETDKWLDIYRCTYPSPSGALDNLYIKLKLFKSCVSVVLHSFHRER